MLLKLLERGVKDGTIHLEYGDGRSYRFGHGAPRVAWHLRNRGTGERIARNHPLQLGQTYMDGDWHVAGGTLQDLLWVLRRNFSDRSPPRMLVPAVKMLQQWNNLTASSRNVSRHYDLDRQLFELFLDRDMHYSCAYFEREGASLDEAQQAKCRHIARKLLLRPGDRVLDIGCGWGSFARYLAQHHDVEVTGITLSREQLEYARSRSRNQGLGNLRFGLEDYREHEDRYDRIVSIGMFEHVGRPFHRTFFRQVKRLLKPDGVALIHTIGRSTPPGPTNPWIRRYIFPGGAIPALSELAGAAEQSGVMQTDIEVLRLHYAYTLRAWYDRFQLHRADIAERLGETFCRMWEFYLAACEVSFRCADLLVYQQQLALQHGSVPATRDYLYEPWQGSGTARREARSYPVVPGR